MQMHTHRRTAAAIVCTLIAAASLHAQVYLQYTLAPNQSYAYESVGRVTQTMSAMDQDVASTTTATIKMRARVREAVMRQYTVECSYDTAQIRLQTQGAEGMLPSDSVMTLPMFADRKETFTISPLGSVLKTTTSGNDDLQAAMSMISGNGNAGAQGLFLTYPGKEVTVGTTWERATVDTVMRSQMPGSMQTKSVMQYTFTGVVDTLGTKCARIMLRSKELVLTGTMQAMGMDMVLDGDGDVTGILYTELATGMKMLEVTSTVLNTRMSMTGQGQAIIPITTETVTTLRRLP